MSSVNVLNVQVLDNPAAFTAPIKVEITFECISALANGSAEKKECDQVLENIVLGPVAVGSYRFSLLAKAPDWTKIPREDLVGVTVMLLSCFYRQQEFIRVGYYVNNAYEDDPITAASTTPAPQTPSSTSAHSNAPAIQNSNSQPLPDPSLSWPNPHEPNRIIRTILAENPRVTLFPIYWDDSERLRDLDALARQDVDEDDVLDDNEGDLDGEDVEDNEDDDDDGDDEDLGSYNENEEMTDAFGEDDEDEDDEPEKPSS